MGRVFALIVAGAWVVSSAGCVQEPSAGTAQRSRSADTGIVRRALQFATVAVPSRRARTSPWLTGDALARWVRRRAQIIPLPLGGNFNGIRWPLAGPSMSVSDADTVLSQNARCQWLRAQRDGRDARTATAVLDVIRTRWPAFSTPGAAAGRFDVDAVADCDRSLLREQQFAAREGLPGPR